MGRLQGKTAIITGAGSGIGAATAHRLAREGANIVVADINAQNADRTVAEIRSAGHEAMSAVFDLSDSVSIEDLVAGTINRYGGLEVLFNNAAATHLGATVDKQIAEADPDIWDETMRINLRGTMVISKHAAVHMAYAGGGSIINASSGAGLSGDLGHPAYGASKAAVARLTTYVASEFGKQGVRCNAIAPGMIITEQTKKSYAADSTRDMMLRHTLTPRLGEPDDIANMVLFLASDESAFVTGQILSVDGGLLAHVPYLADMRDMVAVG